MVYKFGLLFQLNMTFIQTKYDLIFICLFVYTLKALRPHILVLRDNFVSNIYQQLGYITIPETSILVSLWPVLQSTCLTYFVGCLFFLWLIGVEFR